MTTEQNKAKKFLKRIGWFNAAEPIEIVKETPKFYRLADGSSAHKEEKGYQVWTEEQVTTYYADKEKKRLLDSEVNRISKLAREKVNAWAAVERLVTSQTMGATVTEEKLAEAKRLLEKLMPTEHT